MSAKTILTSDQAHPALLENIRSTARLVGLTMGPSGRNVMVERDYGGRFSRDGVSITRLLEFDDRLAQIAAGLLNKVAVQMSDKAGDGTSVAVSLAASMIEEGLKARAAGAPVNEFRSGMEIAAEKTIEELTHLAAPASDALLRRIAETASHGDRQLAQVAVDTLTGLHADGFVSVEAGDSHETEVDNCKSLTIDSGFVAHEFGAKSVNGERTLDDAFILVTDYKLAALNPLVPLFDAVHATGKPMLVVAGDVTGEALSTLLVNDRSGAFTSVAIKAPESGQHQHEVLTDLAIATGAKPVFSNHGMKIEDVALEHLGRCSRATINGAKTMIEDGAANPIMVDERRQTLRHLRDNAGSEFEKDHLARRLAWLCGRSVTIRVGGLTEDDIKERRDRMVNCVHSVRSAQSTGVLPGAGVGLIFAAKALARVELDSHGKQAGLLALQRSLEHPARQVLDNQGFDAGHMVGLVFERKGYAHFLTQGPLDPVDTIRNAIAIAASAAKTLISAECFLLDATD